MCIYGFVIFGDLSEFLFFREKERVVVTMFIRRRALCCARDFRDCFDGRDEREEADFFVFAFFFCLIGIFVNGILLLTT